MTPNIVDDAGKLLVGLERSLYPFVWKNRPQDLILPDNLEVRLFFHFRADAFKQICLKGFLKSPVPVDGTPLISDEIAKNSTLFGIPVKVTQNADAPSVALMLEPTDSKCYLRRYLDTYLPPFPAIPPGSQNNKNTKETTMVKTKKPAAKKTPAKAAAPKKAAPAKAPAVKKSAAKKPCKKCCKGK